MSHGPASALNHAPFRALLVGQTVTSLGNGIAPIALAFGVLDLGGSPAELGLVGAAYAVTFAAALLWGGVIGDRGARDKIMVGSSVVRGVIQVLTAAVVLSSVGGVPALALLSAISGVLTGLSVPSSRSVTPLTVPAQALPSAVKVRALSQDSARIAGTAVAGVLVVAIGPGWAILIDALTFFVAAAAFAAMRLPAAPRPGTDRPSVLSDVRDGLAEVVHQRWLLLTIGQAMVFHLAYGGVEGVLGPTVVGEGIGRDVWGWAMAALGVGVVAGSLLSMRIHPPRPLVTAMLALASTGAFPVAMGLAEGPAPLLAAAFVHGLGLQLYSVLMDVAVQEGVPTDKLARVYAIDQVGSLATRPLGLALVGPALLVAPAEALLVGVGVVLGASALLLLASRTIRLHAPSAASSVEPVSS